MYAPVRGGNRGGWDQFKWDDVRLMSYKDRECYLGASERLGYLDKGGKWRKRDWWVGTKDDNTISDEMRREIERVKREDEALMRQKLGLEPHKDVKQVLDELQNEGNDPHLLNKLTDYELKELTAKNGMLPQHSNQGFENGAATEMMTDQREMADRVGGLGFEQRITMNKKLIELQRDSKKGGGSGKDQERDINQLEGIGIEDTKYLDQRKKLVMINYLKEKIEQQKRDKKEQKKARKEEKRKKKEERKRDKHKKKHSSHKRWNDSRSRSDSRSVSKDRDRNEVKQVSSDEKNIKSSSNNRKQLQGNMKIVDDSDMSSVRDPSEDNVNYKDELPSRSHEKDQHRDHQYRYVSRSRSRSIGRKDTYRIQPKNKEEVKEIKAHDKNVRREVSREDHDSKRDKHDDQNKSRDHYRDDRHKRDDRRRDYDNRRDYDQRRRDDRERGHYNSDRRYKDDREQDDRKRKDDYRRNDKNDRYREKDRYRDKDSGDNKNMKKRSHSNSSKSSSSSFLSE